MPTKQLSDTRDNIQTMDEARAVFNQLAQLEILNEKILAQAESQVAKIKDKAEARILIECAELPELKAKLARFIETHKNEFKKPRNVKTSFGQFGLQKASKVEITNKKNCLEYLDAAEMTDCLKISTKIDRAGLKAALEAGTFVDGAELKKGDIAHYRVSKALLDEAKAVE